MAKARSNFRGTTRQLYNPKTVKYLEAPDARKEYQQLRRVALKRAARLEKAGLGYLAEAHPDLPLSSTLSDEMIKDQLLNVSEYLRDPYSLVKPARETLEIPQGMERVTIKGKTQIREVPDMGEIINKDRKRFGDYMDDLRLKQSEKAMKEKYGRRWREFMDTAESRAAGRLPGSDWVRTAYEEAMRRRMKPETLRKHFADYLTDAEKAEKLASTLYHAPAKERMTIQKVKEMLE